MDEDISEMYKIATQKGEALKEVEKRNKRRRAKGLPPILDESEKADLAVSRRRYRTNDPTTVDGAEALKLFQMRKAQMEMETDVDDEDEVEQIPVPPQKKTKKPSKEDAETERAIREAAAVRRIEDMKNGRINHGSVWSGEGDNKTEGGDETRLKDSMKQKPPEVPTNEAEAASPQEQPAHIPDVKSFPKVSDELFRAFVSDLYERLRISFDSLEKSMSDLQGRVMEMSKLPAAEDTQEDETPKIESAFESLLEQRTPVVFNVGGTKMSFDAVKIFYNSPCITILTKAGSANIMPEPGARLLLTYEMNGNKYVNDPVTFVGLRVDLNEFGMSFVGFVRDKETDLMDVGGNSN